MIDETMFEALLGKVNYLEDRLESLTCTVNTNTEIQQILSKDIHEKLNNEQKVLVPYWLVDDTAKLPERKKDGDIGYDAYSNDNIIIKAHTSEKVSLGIGMIVPRGFGVHARNRSGNYLGNTYESPIDIGDAWVDNNYRGIIHALIQNNGSQDIEIKSGDRVCSIDIVKTYAFEFIPIDEYCDKFGIDKDSLMNTNRGELGFGSTGK